ncbi:NosD domain-containing protein [Verrucomicrobiota bacterium]
MRRMDVALLVLVLCVLAVGASAVGNLIPPNSAFSNGQPAAHMKSIEEVEPRSPISDIPFVITNSGSYYLIESLGGTNGKHGIVITDDDVHLDLNGFSIWGVTGSLAGISVSGEVNNVSVRNGVIGEWGGWGIDATNAHGCVLSRITVYTNQAGGMRVGSDSTLVECTAAESPGPGIVVGDASSLRDCKAFENGQDGIRTANGCRLDGCTTYENGSNGIVVETYCFVKECVCAENGLSGISADWNCVLSGNICGENGTVSSNGAGICIQSSGNRIQDNNLTANHYGLWLKDCGNRVSENNIMENHVGVLDEGGTNFIFRNTIGFSNSGTNLDVRLPTYNGAMMKNPGSNFTNTNPWANLEME